MRRIGILALNSWEENLRSRFFLLCAAFGVVTLYVSMLLGLLAADQEKRVLLDFGLGFIELMGLAGALYGASTGLLRELETKTIYLILTRPVSRTEFLLGRFAGLMLSVAASMGLMAAVHLTILLFKGWHWSNAYLGALLGAYLKVLITAALATFLALFSTSVLTALSIALILWTLGHFLPELRFMIAWGAPHPAMVPLRALAAVIPDLQLLNLRDRIGPATISPREAGLLARLAYAGAYSAVWLALAGLLLRRKEL